MIYSSSRATRNVGRIFHISPNLSVNDRGASPCTLSVVEDRPREVPLCEHGAHPPAAPSWHRASCCHTRSPLAHELSVSSSFIGASARAGMALAF